MKKFLSILMIMCLSFAGLLVGCDEGRYDDLTISIRTEQERAEDGSITLYVGEGEEDITVTMAGAPDEFNYVPTFSLSENIVKIGEVNHMVKNGVRKTIQGIAPGFTVLTAYTSEGSKTATLKINVVKKAESIEYNTHYKLAVLNVPGHKVTIDTNSAISIFPKDSNQNKIKYSLATTGLSDVVGIQDNVLTTLSGITTTALESFKVKAEVVDHRGEPNPNVDPVYMDVKIMDNILPSDISLYQSRTETGALTPAVLANPITTTIVLSKNFVENNFINVFIGVDTTEDITITPPPNLNSSPVMISKVGGFTNSGVKFFVYRVQAIRYSAPIDVEFKISVDGYEAMYSFSTKINVKCELYIRNFSVNDETLVEGEDHTTTLYTNDETSGTRIKIAVGNPKEILAADAKFFLSFYTNKGTVDTPDWQLVEDYSKYFILTNVSNNAQGISPDGYLKEAAFNLKLKAGTLNPTDHSEKYRLTITAEQPTAYTYKATTSVVIRIVQGIQQIKDITYREETTDNTVPIKINYEDIDTPLEVVVNATPASETSYETLYAESSNASVFRVEKKSPASNVFLIYAEGIGDAEVRFCSRNLSSPLTYKVNVYEDIENFFVSIDDFTQLPFIGTSTVEDNSLKSAVIKTTNINTWSSEIKLAINTLPTNARFYQTSVEVLNKEGTALTLNGNYLQDDNFKFNVNNMKFSIRFVDVDYYYTVKLTMTNFDGTKITKEFTVKAYIPITKISMSLTNDTLYNPNKLGYFDLNHTTKTYTKTQATIAVNPNATYGTQDNIFFEVIVNGIVTENLLIRTGNEFRLNPDFVIEKYPQKVYMIAYALEFGKRVETEAYIITIRDPITVESMAVEGDINGDILYFKLDYDESKDIKISLDPSTNLFNSGVKWVQYAEGTTRVLDFADNGNPMMTPVDTTEAIFSVEARGNNVFRVNALQAGNARFLLIPEDKITDVDGSLYVYDWDKVVELFVSVADGTRQNPYHVASFSDFKEIETAMDKFYVLTNDIIVEDNWEALGYKSKTPMNGGINGLYSRIINADTGEKYSIQYQIKEVSFAVSFASNITHHGLIYQLGDGVVIEGHEGEDKAILENLIVSYSYIQAEFSGDYTFGGLVAINKGLIDNCSVSISNTSIALSGMNYTIGGLVGKNDGGTISNALVDNAANINMKIELKADSFLTAYFGGLVGHMTSGTLNGYQKDYTEIGSLGITFGNQGYDVVANITITTSKTYPPEMVSAVGGVVGYIKNTETTTVSISDYAVNGTINATPINNVGGIAGHIDGVPDKDTNNLITLFNNTNNAKIYGNSYVGGVVAKANYATFSYCSAENYRETQTTPRRFITGVDFVGGFGGLVENSNISYCYVVSYFENKDGFKSDDLTEDNCDMAVLSATDSTESRAGGFIASLVLQSSNTVEKVATMLNTYIKTNNKRYVAGVFGYYNGSGVVNHLLCKGFASSGTNEVTAPGSSGIPNTSTYYSTLNLVAFSSLSDVMAKGNGPYDAKNPDDSYIWDTDAEINNSLPYLLDGEGNILFAFLPIEVKVTMQDNSSLIDTDLDAYNNSGYVYVDNVAVLIYLNQIKNDVLTDDQLLKLNTHKITEFASLEVIPLTLKTSRLVITSNNTGVVRVVEDSLIILKEGSARITISSKLNADYRCEFYVIVKNGVNNYKLYETSNFDETSEVKDDDKAPIKMIVDKKFALYENTEYVRNVNGVDYALKETNSTYVRFELENEDFKDSFIINTSWTIEEDIYTEIAVSTLTTIYSKMVTKDGEDIIPVRVTATPYIEVSYLSNTRRIDFDHLATAFYLKIMNGADDIYFESSISETQGIEITQLQSFVFTVIMDTDTNDDGIISYMTDAEGNIIDDTGAYTGSVIKLVTNSGSEANITKTVDGKEILVGKRASYTISYDAATNEDGSMETLREDKKFFIYFYSKLVPDVIVSLPITVKPQDIVSADMGLYSSTGDYNTNVSGTTKDGTDKFIFNGEVALLTVEIYPDFSKFERFDIVYTSATGFPISMTQLKYTKNAAATDDPFSTMTDNAGEYITGYGIKVKKVSGAEPLLGSGSGTYSYSYIYYFSLLVGSEVPDLATFTMTLVFYNGEGDIIAPRNISYTFQSLSSPQLQLAVKDTTLNNNLPLGTKNEINVQTKNFVGDISWKISIENNGNEQAESAYKCATCTTKSINPQYTECVECMNKNYALLNSLIPAKDANGKYYLTIPSDNFNLLGRFIIVTGVIEKSENNQSFKATASIRVYVTLFTVTDMSVDGLSADTLKLQIYTPYALKVNLAAVYSETVDFKNHPRKEQINPNGYTIANMVSRLRDEISKSAIWSSMEGEGSRLLEKNTGYLYNSTYACISYGDNYAIYGYNVDNISTINASAEIGFTRGFPTYMNPAAAAVVADPDPADPPATEPEVPADMRSRVFARQFSLTFTYQNDIKNPIPVTNAEEFLKMEAGKDYRLTSDIMLTDYVPLTTRILSLDGNGHTVYVASFMKGLTTSNIGLFDTIAGADAMAEATMIYNLKVHYIANVVEEITYVHGEAVYNYILPVPPTKYPQPTIVELAEMTTFNFGGIAGTNNGIITNCEVTGQISVVALDDQLTEETYAGGIVGLNGGYVTSSRVVGLDLSTSGNLGGVAGCNKNTISSTYTDELKINNISKNTDIFYTGGFVCNNEKGAKVLECYTQGVKTANDVNIVNTGLGLYTSGTAGGFVYKNLGDIQNCYSNIAITASAFSAGFVFLNEGDEAVVNNCYSISRVALNSKAASPFTGIGKSGGVVVTYEGQINNCFYLRDNYNDFKNEPATKLELNDFATTSSFGAYNIKLNVDNPYEAEGYSWYISGGKPRLTQTDIKTYSIYDYMGKTKNYTENSEVYFKFDTAAGKWFSYTSTGGYDMSKEVIITRRATVAYFADAGGENHYFKPVFNADGSKKYVNASGADRQLYTEVDDSTKQYILIDNKVHSYNSGAIVDLGYLAIIMTLEEQYSEEYGILYGDKKSSVWKDLETEKLYYKHTKKEADDFTYEFVNISGNVHEEAILYVLNIETSSVLYKDGNTSTLVDLSLDSEGECDFTYIMTSAEYQKANPDATNVPEPYKSYGGGYSYRSLDSIQYHYAIGTAEDGNAHILGSKHNPYLIYDVVSYNTYFTDKFNSELSDINKREYYRVVADIDFDFENISTSRKTLFGFLEGNGMIFKNITLTYVSGNQATTGYGLFSQSLFSIVNNLNLEVIEIASSAHTYVGGLVGWARTDVVTNSVTIEGPGGTPVTNTTAKFNNVDIQGYGDIPEYLLKNYFNNIHVYKKNTQDLDNVGLVLGRNLVGGLVGYMTGYSKANNITCSVNVNAVYVMSADVKGKYVTYQNVKTDAEMTKLAATSAFGPVCSTKADWTYYINRQVSYAGMAFGGIDVEIKTSDDDYKENFSVYDITVEGEWTGAGGIIGGVIGLLADDNIAYNINVDLVEMQSIRGAIYSGGLIGENRGLLLASTIAYPTEAENTVTLVTSTRKNIKFFNNNASTIAIGGLVGFNNGGTVTSCISHVDVRNSVATVAGGAVGRSIAGNYNKVLVSGSVRAKSIMGGFTGTSNTTFSYTENDGLGHPYQSAAYPADNSSVTSVTSASIAGNVDTDNYTACIAATNWQLEDYPYLTEKEAVKRVAGGFIGSEALSPDYYVNMEEDDPTTPIMQLYSVFERCFYTNSLYYGSAGIDTNPSFYMPIGYVSDFDSVRLFTILATTGEQLYPYMYPFFATNELVYSKTAGGTNFDIVGLNHYQIAYGDANMYSENLVDFKEETGEKATITLEFTYDDLSYFETNYFQTTIAKSYYERLFEDTGIDLVNSKYLVKYNKVTRNDLTALDRGYSYKENYGPDGITVDTREFGIMQKFFVYKDFVGAEEFSIKDTFYGTLDSDKYSLYPIIKIKSSSLDWRDYASTMFEKEGDYYLIKNAKELAGLSKLVEAGSTDPADGKKYSDSSKKYKIADDANIDLSGKYWAPIGTQAQPFAAEFEGNGKLISNANISAEGVPYAGVFGYVKGAKIRNLKVTGGSIIGSVSSSTAGGLVGYAENATITNCTNENAVAGTKHVGGIAGHAKNSTITNSYNKGKITYTEGNTELPCIGGIVGKSQDSTLSYKTDAANVATFSSTVNGGEIIVKENTYTSYTADNVHKGKVYVGGIVGNASPTKFVADDFIYNVANITVTTSAHEIYVGGAFGYYTSNEDKSEATAYHISKIRNSGDIAVYDVNVYSPVKGNEFSSKSGESVALAHVGGIIGNYGVGTDATDRIGLLSNTGFILFDNQKSSRSIVGVGGIVGMITGSTVADTDTVTKLDESYNSANIEVKANSGTNIVVGIGGILGMYNAYTTDGDRVDINNCYNMGSIASSGTGKVLSGGIYGVSAIRNKDNYKYAIGNNLLDNEQNIDNNVAFITNTYNIGSITGASNNTYGLGALLGYGAATGGAKLGASCAPQSGGYGYNYYLAGSAAYPYANMAKTTETDPETNEVVTVQAVTYGIQEAFVCEQRTTNTLKLYLEDSQVGISFEGFDADDEEDIIWEQKVTTWYPTLKNNYETLLWNDKTSQLSVSGESFTIENADQLAYLSYAVNNGILDTTGVKFTLTSNIDMSNRFFTPIGSETYPFKGIFNGAGYSINNLTIDSYSALVLISTAETVGSLFGVVDGGQIKNVGLVSPIIKNVDIASGFAYSLINTAHMEYCFTDNYEISDPEVQAVGDETVKFKPGLISARKEVSGLVNTLDNSTISASYVAVIMRTTPGPDPDFKPSMAGFVVTTISSTVSNCYVSNGINNTPIFEYFTSNEATTAMSPFNKFVVNSLGVGADGVTLEPVESIEHCFNLSSGTHKYSESASAVQIDSTLTTSGVTGNTNGANLKDLGWDVIDIWSYEYSLLADISLDSTQSATIRGLGQNWYNTECEDLILKNNLGTLITEKGEDVGNSESNKYIYYEIYTAEELAWVARMINNGKITGKDAKGNQYVFKLMNDINLLHKYWTPIGTLDYPFACKFDFNGYTISNLVIDANNMSFGGLFGYTQEAIITGGFIDNCYINIDITSEEYNALTSVKGLYVGALVGKGNNTIIDNIKITGTNIIGYSKYNSYVGGLAGNLTYAKSNVSATNYGVNNIYVENVDGTEILIPEEYRKNNGFGIDEIITEATIFDKLQVNTAGISLTGNTYVGGVIGYVSGKYTINYSTVANIKKIYNDSTVVAYAKAEIARSYCGGVVGYMTENTTLDIAQNNGKVKSATYGYDYIGGVAGIIDGGSTIQNVLNKGYVECSQFASVISYSGGVGGYIRSGSTARLSANLGRSFKNVDSSKIFSAGGFGYVEKDDTGAIPTITYVAYSDDHDSYTNLDGDTIGYYGDEELNSTAVIYVSSLEDATVAGEFGADPNTWQIASGSLIYWTAYDLSFDSTVSVYYKNGSGVFEQIGGDAGGNTQLAVGTELIIKTNTTIPAGSVAFINVNGRKYQATHVFVDSPFGATKAGTGDVANCIVIKHLANGITGINSEIGTV